MRRVGCLRSAAARSSACRRLSPITVVDAVGAGDAFVAGFLSEYVTGADIAACLRVGNLLGGAVCQAPGDWEGLPTREELFAGAGSDEIIR